MAVVLGLVVVDVPVAVGGEVGVGEVQLLIMFHVYIHLCIRKSNHINPVDYIC